MLLFLLHINFKEDFCYLLFLGIQSLSVFISNCGTVCSLSVLSDYCFIPCSFSARWCPSVPLSLVPMWTTAKSSHFLWGRPHIVREENQHATPTYIVSDNKIFHILSLLIRWHPVFHGVTESDPPLCDDLVVFKQSTICGFGLGFFLFYLARS